MATRIVSFGNRANENVTVDSVSGSGPYTLTLSSATTTTHNGDTIEDSAGEIYLITAGEGSTSLTVEDRLGAGTAPSTGAGHTERTYTDLSLAETGLNNTTLWDSGDEQIIECHADQSAFDITSALIWNTARTATVRPSIRAHEDSRHDGTAGTGVVFNAKSSTSYTFATSSSTRAFSFEYLDFTTDFAGNFFTHLYLATNPTTPVTTARGCICRNIERTSGTGTTGAYGIYVRDTNDVFNCLTYDIEYNILSSGGAWGVYLQLSGSEDVRLINHTAHDQRVTHASATGDCHNYRIADQADTEYRNILGTDTSNDGSGLNRAYSDTSITAASADNLGCDDTSASGNNPLESITPSDQYVSTTAGSEDLHLKEGADCIDAGSDGGSDNGQDYDLDHVQRTGTWDIGADQYTVAAAANGTILSRKTGVELVNPHELIW